MKKSFTKSAFRQILSNKSRFIAIFAIVLIGVGFFAGLLASGDDMRLGADLYFDDYHLMDFRLISTYGFSERDVNTLADMQGAHVYPSYFSDFIVTSNENEMVCRAYSYNPDYDINTPYLVSGRFPETDSECLIISSAFGTDMLGKKITLSLDGDEDIDEVLDRREFTVVGTFYSPMYVSATQYGSTTIS